MVLAGLVAELREHGKRPVDLFNACDTDRDGLISAEDFTAGLRQLHVHDQRRLSTASLMAQLWRSRGGTRSTPGWL